ncbi:hypothetical protein [Microbacterium rhizosphaerae]|uniref:DUF402 domain-containing protein n=1 Tax=Microbacterium rhizosphaerae TaxID=1678237 RepID=A0ABZ0SSW6_9MICO|nr:hypothetical protein [Microbacterium rhizosphaerae]WPR91354.1 hypothetical protein SM116_08780 [Microbacterium rhizosphaerae]
MAEVGFAGSPGIDRSKLKYHALRPSTQYRSLWWETPDGATTQAPAAAHRAERDVSPATLIRRTWESLELPGTAADWHFTLLDATSQLWRLRTRQPEHLAICEQFCRIDINLVRVRPEPFWLGDSAAKGFVSIPTFDILIKILRAVDELDEALDYARLGVPFGQGTEREVEELEVALGAGV